MGVSQETTRFDEPGYSTKYERMSRAISAHEIGDRRSIKLVHLEDVLRENGSKRRLTFMQEFWRHIARFWFCYGIAGFLFLAIMLPLLFLVIIPALAQRIVNDTTLPIRAADLRAISNNQVGVGLSTSITTPANLQVDLDGFEMFLFDSASSLEPFTSITFPSQTLKGYTELDISGITAEILDRRELFRWLSRTFYNDSSDVTLRGETAAYLGMLKSPIKLDKTVTIDALRGLSGYAMQDDGDATIMLPADPSDGSNIRGRILLPNWSPLTIGLGNLTLNVWSGDLLIGQASMDDVVLPPGNNSLPFRGTVFMETVFDNVIRLAGSQASSIFQGVITLGISGNATTVDGEHIEYLEGVLNVARLQTELPIAQLISTAIRSVAGGTLDIKSAWGTMVAGLLGMTDNNGDGMDDNGGGPVPGSLNGINDGSGNGTANNVTTSGLLGDLLDNLNVTQLLGGKQAGAKQVASLREHQAQWDQLLKGAGYGGRRWW